MFLPERYRRNPWRRPSTVAAEPPTDGVNTPEPDLEAEAGDWDDPDAEDEEAELSDAEFYQSLRRDVAGCREGSILSIAAAQRSSPKDRPCGRRHKRRDRHGNAF